MPLTMEARKEVSEQLRSKYRKGKKKQKSAILDHVVELTGWNRKHAAAVLNGAAPIAGKMNKRVGRDRRGRKPKYSLKHLEVIKKVWRHWIFPHPHE